ncbi:N-acetyltransferase family protein [Tsukamurella ocularis]|uniref:GNAT family N-acetyltransferase n=1 Tax=Tsukamurella ocularis TaxID=1970234 RepID=UPI0039F0A2A1
MTDTIIRTVTPGDEAALAAMFAGLSERDRTVIREDLTGPTTGIADGPGLRWVATTEDGTVDGYAALTRLPGWSDHVGELRLVVGAARRGSGIGRRLVQEALRAGIAAGLTKVMIELATDEERVLTMFSELGFTGEALLRDHIRGRDGELRDLIVLAHHAHESAEAIGLIGVADDLA